MPYSSELFWKLKNLLTVFWDVHVLITFALFIVIHSYQESQPWSCRSELPFSYLRHKAKEQNVWSHSRTLSLPFNSGITLCNSCNLYWYTGKIKLWCLMIIAMCMNHPACFSESSFSFTNPIDLFAFSTILTLKFSHIYYFSLSLLLVKSSIFSED